MDPKDYTPLMAPKYKMRHAFSHALYTYMKSQGITTYYGLSTKTGLNMKTAEKIFRPEYGGPNFDTLQQIATGFGFTPGQFLNKIEKIHRKIKKNLT